MNSLNLKESKAGTLLELNERLQSLKKFENNEKVLSRKKHVAGEL